MELGQYQLQIFVSLVVILGAAFVALICDFLKGNNEQLRELTVELKVRREEEQRRSQTLTPQTVAAAAAPATVEMPKAQKKIETRAARAMAAPKEPRRTIAPEALAAMERGAQLARAPRARAAAAAAGADAHRAERRPAGTKQEEAPAAVVETKQEAPAVVETVEKPVTPVKTMAAGKKDWNALLSRRANKSETVVQIRTEAPEASKDSAPVPAGFHDGFILSKLVQKRQPVSGLVVSIGVSVPRDASGSAPEAVKQMIQSLIGAGDFACQSGEEEFLLIYPNQQGASAQRKLSQIAQQLWDFQLRSMGTFSILFSWGGVEVASESIEEAIASANERMQETRRSRKLLTMQPRETPAQQALPVRQAV